MGELGKWADENNQFFRLELGETQEATYKGFKIIPNKFDPEKDTIRYELVVRGTKKFWENGSTRVAASFDKIKFGDSVKITREFTKDGKGRYLVVPSENNLSLDDVL